MFVFGFVGDSLAATTTDPLLWAIQTLKMLTPGKQKEQCTEEVVAGKSGSYSRLFDIFGYIVPELRLHHCPQLLPVIDSEL